MGIIPAYAGNTAASIPQVSASWDHPRVCGEHQWQVHDNPMPLGSSPRMRGTLKRVHRHRHATRIIPAYAGNTNDADSYSTARRDHPRVCGEHDHHLGVVPVVQGSSPRIRGTLIHFRLATHGAGIIPAYAGNTYDGVGYSRPDRDHPRVCGEHRKRRNVMPDATGSSPRMRGTQYLVHFVLHLLGIIPAYAGNTNPFTSYSITDEDHPRVCGEHPIPHIPRDVTQGSSPRMRGTPLYSTPIGWNDGIIPAYAGNTSLDMVRILVCRDHPRVCGEHERYRQSYRQTVGSSPRMRGTQQ